MQTSHIAGAGGGLEGVCERPRRARRSAEAHESAYLRTKIVLTSASKLQKSAGFAEAQAALAAMRRAGTIRLVAGARGKIVPIGGDVHTPAVGRLAQRLAEARRPPPRRPRRRRRSAWRRERRKVAGLEEGAAGRRCADDTAGS